MNLATRLFIVIGFGASVATTGLLVYTYNMTKNDTYHQLERESDSIYNFLMAARRVGQKQFLDSGIELTDKTVGFLPAHSLPRVSEEFSKNWDHRGIVIRTSSDRPRNPRNIVNNYEQLAMDWFRGNDRSDNENSKYIVRGAKKFFYARPIWVVKSCLKCHGAREDAPTTIRERYSEAYDYEIGELRGVVSISTPTEEISGSIIKSFLPRFGILFGSFLLVIFLVNQMVQKFIVHSNQNRDD